MRQTTLEQKLVHKSRNLRWSLAQFACALFLVSCERPPPNEDRSQLPDTTRESFLVFTAKRLYVDKLEDPIPMPIAVGSIASPTTVESDAAEIVSVNDKGYLIAHRNGNAFVHARGNGSNGFTVEVRSITGLWVTPGVAELKAGEALPLKIIANDGSLVNPEAMTWATSDPSVATVDRGRIEAGKHFGRARLVATYGGVTAQVLVTVSDRTSNSPSFRVAPGKLPVGSIRRYELSEPPPPGATWSTRNAQVLVSLGDGFFWARALGNSSACVEFGTNHACTRVEVTK